MCACIDLFFKGGETIRGFDRAGYGPRDLNTNDALGGQTYWATTAEVRFPHPVRARRPRHPAAPCSPTPARCSVRARSQATLPQGCSLPATRPSVCLADSSAIRSSVGASLMWNSPVGPIRMDFAKVLTKETYDQEQFFRFGAATKF